MVKLALRMCNSHANALCYILWWFMVAFEVLTESLSIHHLVAECICHLHRVLILFESSSFLKPTTGIYNMCIMKERYVWGVYLTVYVIIPTLFLSFLPFCYPCILLHFYYLFVIFLAAGACLS